MVVKRTKIVIITYGDMTIQSFPKFLSDSMVVKGSLETSRNIFYNSHVLEIRKYFNL